jgi:hypothetical protein
VSDTKSAGVLAIFVKDKQSNFNQNTPVIVWCVRLLLCLAILYFGKYLFVSISAAASAGRNILGGFLVLSSVALLASFVRSKTSLVLMILAIVAIPLFVFLGMDFFVLRGEWWENCFALLIQMAIPIAVAVFMWKAPSIKNYYSNSSSNLES